MHLSTTSLSSSNNCNRNNRDSVGVKVEELEV